MFLFSFTFDFCDGVSQPFFIGFRAFWRSAFLGSGASGGRRRLPGRRRRRSAASRNSRSANKEKQKIFVDEKKTQFLCVFFFTLLRGEAEPSFWRAGEAREAAGAEGRVPERPHCWKREKETQHENEEKQQKQTQRFAVLAGS